MQGVKKFFNMQQVFFFLRNTAYVYLEYKTKCSKRNFYKAKFLALLWGIAYEEKYANIYKGLNFSYRSAKAFGF